MFIDTFMLCNSCKDFAKCFLFCILLHLGINDMLTHRFTCLQELQDTHKFNLFNTLRPRANGRLFADDTFKRIFLNENNRISIKISLKFVSKGPFNNIPALVLIMAWRRPGDKPLSEPMLVGSLTQICVTWPQ